MCRLLDSVTTLQPMASTVKLYAIRNIVQGSLTSCSRKFYVSGISDFLNTDAFWKNTTTD